jgi:hypothetical protein
VNEIWLNFNRWSRKSEMVAMTLFQNNFLDSYILGKNVSWNNFDNAKFKVTRDAYVFFGWLTINYNDMSQVLGWNCETYHHYMYMFVPVNVFA